MEEHQRQDLYEMLGRLNATTDLILEGLKTHFEDDKKNFSDIRDKIHAVEGRINYAAGGLALLGSIMILVGNWIAKKLGIV